MSDEQVIISPAQQLVTQLGYDEALEYASRMAGFVAVPPTIDQFLDQSDFMGDIFKRTPVFPTWRGVLRTVFPDPFYCKFREIAFTGAIGLGKSTAALLGMSFDLCRLMYLEDPHEMFGLESSDPLVVAFINTTKTLSEDTLQGRFLKWLGRSEFFLSQSAKVPKPPGNRKRDILPHSVKLVSGSRASHSYGRAVIMGILCELNFQGSSTKDQAVENYTSTSRRMDSRFQRGEGFMMPGRLWLDSSKSDERGFLEQHLKDLEKDREHSLIVCKAIWEIQAEKGIKFDKWFKVFIGDPTRDPEILEGPGSAYNIPEALVIDVPESFRRFFQSDIYGSLRDYAGVSTWGAHKFLPWEYIVREACSKKNPCFQKVIALDFDSKTECLINFIDWTKLAHDHSRCNREGLDHPPPDAASSPYYVHFDLGSVMGTSKSRDRVGVGFSRNLGEVPVERTNPHTHVTAMTSDHMFHTDLVLAVVPKPGKTVPLSKFRDLIVDLRNRGVPIAACSSDSHQAAGLQQLIQEQGIPYTIVSVDTKRDAYDHFKDALVERRWTGTDHEILITELLNLEDQGKKIDHPENSDMRTGGERFSKDLSDGVVGSVWNCRLNTQSGKSLTAFEEYAKALEKHNEPKLDEKAELFKQGMILKKRQNNKWG